MARKMVWVAATAAALGLMIGSVAVAQPDVVKERQDAMKAQGGDSKAINDYIKGTGDKDAAMKAAQDLAARSQSYGRLFPAGTSLMDLPGKTQAKPEIWADKAKFDGIFTTMHDKAMALASTIQNGSTDDVKAAFMDLNKSSCGACHSQFRQPENH